MRLFFGLELRMTVPTQFVETTSARFDPSARLLQPHHRSSCRYSLSEYQLYATIDYQQRAACDTIVSSIHHQKYTANLQHISIHCSFHRIWVQSHLRHHSPMHKSLNS